MAERKKKILIHSNHCKAFTGFGKHKKNLLKYLYKTGKYEIVELSNAKHKDQVPNTPWKALGTLPSNKKALMELSKDPTKQRNAGYGHELINEIIEEEKPDIYLGIEDIWAFSGFTSRSWWNKMHCMIHTTLDSVPLLPESIQAAPKIKHYFVWASFAQRELERVGHTHIQTVRGSLETKNFFKINKKERADLRDGHGLSKNFVIGFVFRNQLRKSVPNLLEGFKKFKAAHPDSSPKLLLHTHWAEGWDIPTLIKEKKLDNNDIVTTYICGKCHQYFIRSHTGQAQDCPACNTNGSLHTTNIKVGVSEQQLNEVYNLMDVYCHPFTSGGQEIPIQEAKLTELITLVTNYSCGEDCCAPNSGGFPLEWAEYREPGTQFIKASTSAVSIFNQLSKVYKMDSSEREEKGKEARKFVVDNYSIEVVGKFFEDLFDELPLIDWSSIDLSSVKLEKRYPDYQPPDEPNNSKWLLDLYKKMLGMDIDETDNGYKYWMNEFVKGKERKDIFNFFVQTAKKENAELFKKSLKEEVDFKRPNKRIAYVMPEHEEDVFMSLSVVKSLKQLYPDHDIYFFTAQKHFPLIDESSDIYKICEFYNEMDDCFYFEGKADEEGLFDMAFLPWLETKRALNYTRHGRDKLQFDLI
jgi:glycosyltransferase involved in cell wall biosynthesis